MAKAFRIYYSEGQKSAKNKNDYIVDHSIIMYLIDPEGQFQDHYGQNRRPREIVNAIRGRILNWELNKMKEQSWLETFRRNYWKEKNEGKEVKTTDKAVA